jgi:hypothetical protein
MFCCEASNNHCVQKVLLAIPKLSPELIGCAPVIPLNNSLSGGRTVRENKKKSRNMFTYLPVNII